MYSVVDLFSGAGGLSLGFQQTNKYEVKAAFENNKYAQKTYTRNHPGVQVYGDVCSADYKMLSKKYGAIDVVIGGPPCQGFSNANRQKNCAVSHNNMLVKQYIRAIIELQPKAFIMENVGMLKSDIHRFYMTQSDQKTVADYDIKTTDTSIELLENKYLFEEVLDIVQDIDKTNAYLWDPIDYAVINNIYRHKKNTTKLELSIRKNFNKLEKVITKHQLLEVSENDSILQADEQCISAITKYFSQQIGVDELVGEIEPALMYQRMLGKAKEFCDNDIIVKRFDHEQNLEAVIESYAVYDYLTAILGAEQNGYKIDSGVLSAADFGAPQKRMRFVVVGIKKEISSEISLPKGGFSQDAYTTVKDAISDIADIKPVYAISDDRGIRLHRKESNISELGKQLRDSDILFNHIITETRETALKRFAAIKQGENFHSLDSEMKEDTYTDVSRTQNTIYLRLDYNAPSGTVVNVRKSMWIHPEHNRAVSVREAARLQTFPDSFVFEGTKDAQYQQVGNAVPPILAKAIADSLADILDKKI